MKKLLKVGESGSVDYASIGWIHSENTRRHVKGASAKDNTFGNPLLDVDIPADVELNGEQLAQSPLVRYMSRGWVASIGAVVEVEIASESDQKRIIAARRKRIDDWRAGNYPEAGLTGWSVGPQLAKTAETVWFPGGKPIVPDYLANMMYRRSDAIMGVIHRRSNEPGFKGDYSFPVVAEVHAYASDVDRFAAHVLENQGKDQGRAGYSFTDLLFSAAKLKEIPGSVESDLLKIGILPGTKQLIWRFFGLDRKYRNLGGEGSLVDRAFLSPDIVKETGRPRYVRGGWIPVPTLGKEELHRVNNDKAWSESGKLEELTNVNYDVDAIESFIEARLNGRVNAKKMVERKRLEGMAEPDVQHCHLLTSIMYAVLNGDNAYFNRFTPSVCAKINKALEPLSTDLYLNAALPTIMQAQPPKEDGKDRTDEGFPEGTLEATPAKPKKESTVKAGRKNK